ncbi:unnamed protein product [Schistocephalus solidus]|uniref:Uncharacterized protein n=1 Tax=Schistocephalus solidus TaxID=70667 RepID=A0A183SYD2_SCHSO|nr:unnamed protein product [Schistocephalus solidus]
MRRISDVKITLRKKKLFNILAFGSEVVAWHSAHPRFADVEACHDAIAWLHQLCATGEADGSVCLGAALTAALEQTELAVTQRVPNAQTSDQNLKLGIYLVTDCAPGKVCSQTLATFFDARTHLTRFVHSLVPTKKKDEQEAFPCLNSLPRVHAITIGERDVTTESLLRALSHHCEGRFLSTTETQLPIKEYIEARDRQLLGESMEPKVDRATGMELPPLKSDDLLLLLKEINKCFSMLREVTGYRRLLQQKTQVTPNTA